MRGIRHQDDGVLHIRSRQVCDFMLSPEIVSDLAYSWLELGVPSAMELDSLLTHPVVSKIAERHNATTGQVLLRWCTQRNIVVIPKTIKPERMAENLKSSAVELTKEDIEAISGLDKGFRIGNTKVFDPRLAIYA